MGGGSRADDLLVALGARVAEAKAQLPQGTSLVARSEGGAITRLGQRPGMCPLKI